MGMNFERYAAKANKMIKEVALELGDQYNTEKATRVLRAVLHALRNRLTLEESIEFIAQLPIFIKAMYVDSWKVNIKHERIKHLDDFLDEVYIESSKFGFFDFPTNNSILDGVNSVFHVLKNHISEGEINDIVAVLPLELKQLWDEPVTEKL